MKKSILVLSSLVVMTVAMSFSCSRWNDPNPTPNLGCTIKQAYVKDVFENKGGIWSCFYSDSSMNRVDLQADMLASPVLYNKIVFKNGRLIEYNYLGVQIDTGTVRYTNCGSQFIVKTNLSSVNQNKELICDITYFSKDSVQSKILIAELPFIKFFTIVKK